MGAGASPRPLNIRRRSSVRTFFTGSPEGACFPYRSSVPNSPLSHLRCQAPEFVVSLPLRHNHKCCASHLGGLTMTLPLSCSCSRPMTLVVIASYRTGIHLFWVVSLLFSLVQAIAILLFRMDRLSLDISLGFTNTYREDFRLTSSPFLR